jgi:hypothetical protein
MTFDTKENSQSVERQTMHPWRSHTQSLVSRKKSGIDPLPLRITRYCKVVAVLG